MFITGNNLIPKILQILLMKLVTVAQTVYEIEFLFFQFYLQFTKKDKIYIHLTFLIYPEHTSKVDIYSYKIYN